MKHLGIKTGETVEKICDKAVLALGTIIFAALSYYSLRFTELFRDGTEIIETHRDSVMENLLALAGVLLLFSVIRLWMDQMDEQQKRTVKNIVKIVALVYVTVISIVWVSISCVFPRADAGTISLAAELIGEGEYSTMFPHGYLGHNPHQYGLALMLEILYFFFGAGNYLSFAYFNALCMPLLVYAGYKILHLMFENDVMEVFYFLMMAVCGPLYVYVIHIYGEVSSTAFSMVLIWQVLSYCKTESKASVVGMIISAALACIVRMNSIIVVIAAAIVLIVWGLKKKKAQVLLFVIAMFLATLAANAGIKKMYELRTGVEVGGGIPHISYILMGLEDTEAGPGWFNGTNYSEYADNDFNHDATAQSSMEKTKVRLKELWNDKGAAFNFFKRKVLSQWNAPDYNSFYTVQEFTCEVEELPGITKSIFMGGIRDFLDDFFDGYQFVLYIGVTVLLISGFLRKNSIENHLLLIAIIGGFLFSILWEAMSRYILPYMAFSVPLAAAGLFFLQEKGMQLWRRVKKEEKIKSVGEAIEKFCDKAVLVLGSIIFVALSFFAMIQTEFFREGTEIMETHRDSVLANLLWVVGVLLLFGVIRVCLTRLAENQRSKVKHIVKYVVISCVAIMSVVWVTISHMAPRADAGILSEAAALIGKGEYSTMMPHGYLGHNPHQYGIVLILEIMYFFFGEGNYLAFAYFNALCMPLLVYSGYKILNYILENDILQIYYFLLMLVCGPLYFYVVHIYGEVSSITFGMVLIWQTMRYCRTGSKASAVLMVLTGAFACIVRMNSIIVLIAVAIVLFVFGLGKNRAQVIPLVVCMFLIVSAANAGVRTSYEVRTGIEIGEGMPHISYILMGLQDTEDGPGWFNSTNYKEHEENDYDSEATAVACWEKIKLCLEEFGANKAGALDFLKRKLLTQWNAPDYNSFQTVGHFTCEVEELPEITESIFMGNIREVLNAFFDRYQFIIYLGTAVLLVGGLFRSNSIEKHMLLITIIGGFLFSILWEAKSRYVLPYLVFSVPLAAAGFYMLQEWMGQLWNYIKPRKKVYQGRRDAA